jgi:hypothetical protein
MKICRSCEVFTSIFWSPLLSSSCLPKTFWYPQVGESGKLVPAPTVKKSVFSVFEIIESLRVA